MSTNNDFIDDFIEEYKNQPCLWKANSSNYKNRSRRQEAYMKLIEVASKHGELYNIERTKQKINNLRCAFRHQLKKYTECKNNSKSGKEEPYCPKRRYFESLMFLMEEEKPANRIKLAEKLKEIKMTRVITRKESPPVFKKELLIKKVEPMEITIDTIETSNEGGEQQEEVIELDQEESVQHQIESADMHEESQNCTVHSEDISVAGDSVKESGGVVYHTDVQHSDEEEEGFKIIWPVGQSKPMENMQSNYIRMAPPSQSPPVAPPAQSHSSTTGSNTVSNSAPMTTTIIHHDLTSSGHNSAATQIALPSSITIQPVPKQGDTVIVPDTMQHGAIRRRTISICSNKSQSQLSSTAENYEASQEHRSKKVKIDCTSTDFEKLLSLACSRMNAPDPEPQDNFSMFGKIVAHKMRNMEPQQSMFAEKIIYDVLFEGQMKQLKYPYPVASPYSISASMPVSRSTMYPIRHAGSTSQPGTIVATSSQQPQTFVISSVDCHGAPTEIHATNSTHQTHYSPQGGHYTTTTMGEADVEEQL